MFRNQVLPDARADEVIATSSIAGKSCGPPPDGPPAKFLAGKKGTLSVWIPPAPVAGRPRAPLPLSLREKLGPISTLPAYYPQCFPSLSRRDESRTPSGHLPELPRSPPPPKISKPPVSEAQSPSAWEDLGAAFPDLWQIRRRSQGSPDELEATRLPTLTPGPSSPSFPEKRKVEASPPFYAGKIRRRPTRPAPGNQLVGFFVRPPAFHREAGPTRREIFSLKFGRHFSPETSARRSGTHRRAKSSPIWKGGWPSLASLRASYSQGPWSKLPKTTPQKVKEIARPAGFPETLSSLAPACAPSRTFARNSPAAGTARWPLSAHAPLPARNG